MRNVIHFNPFCHTNQKLRDTVGKNAKRILHRGQNEIWGLIEHTTAYSTYPIILVAHYESFAPVPEIQIDFLKSTGCCDVSEADINELMREFLADKKHCIIYAPKMLEDPLIIDALTYANFVFNDSDNCYVKAPQNR